MDLWFVGSASLVRQTRDPRHPHKTVRISGRKHTFSNKQEVGIVSMFEVLERTLQALPVFPVLAWIGRMKASGHTVCRENNGDRQATRQGSAER